MDDKPKRINPFNLFVGSFLPNWLLRRQELSLSAKVVYARLCQFAGKDGQAFPKIATIASEIGCSTSAVDRAMAELKDSGLIEVVRRGLTRPNSYFFLRHKWMSDTSSTVSLDLSNPGIKIPENGSLDTSSTVSQETPSMTPLLRESEEENQLRDPELPNQGIKIHRLRPSDTSPKARPSDKRTSERVRMSPLEQINSDRGERADPEQAKHFLKQLQEGLDSGP